MKKIFLLIRGQRKGPFSLEEIRRQLDSGEVGIFDVVEADGRRITLQEILPAEESITVPTIRPAPPTAPPPPAEVASAGGAWGGPPPPPLQGRGYPSAPRTAFCRACGQPVMASSVICPGCGSPTVNSSNLSPPPLSAGPQKSPTGFIVAGYICAFLAFLFPLPLGLPAVLIGATNLVKGRVVHGIATIMIATILGIFGWLVGWAALEQM